MTDRRYPTAGAYQEAVQFPSTAFTDPLLREAEPEETLLGLPRAITGAFAVVFPLRVRGARWGVKCFVTNVKDQQDRYRAIAEHLRETPLSYVVPFEYQAEGIRVGDAAYPILKMEWIEGETLNAYVARHVGRPGALDALVVRWRDMADVLEQAAIAHGDLQHGNVLVDGEGELRLVDYDTMFVPPLRGRASPEVGHRNYQHPDRDKTHFGPYLDRFAALAIDTGLRAVAARPELWERYDSGENVLFRSADLADPDASALFEELHTIDKLAGQVEALRRACYLEPEDIPPLHVVVSDTDAMPPAESRRVEARKEKGTFERFIYPLAAGILLIVALIQIVDSVTVALTTAAALTAGAGVWGWFRYRDLPVIRRERRLQGEDAYFRRLLAGLRDEKVRLERRREEMLASHEARYADRLEALQEEALHEKLKYHFVGEARSFEGITHKVVVRLKASGIRTAAHATPEKVASIVLMSEESKGRVNLWRSTLVARYRDDVPGALSPAEERRLRRMLERELEAVDGELARLRAKISLQEEEHRDVLKRREELDAPTFPQYLLRLGSLAR